MVQDPNFNTGNDKDPIKGFTEIAMLLNGTYNWGLTTGNSDVSIQLFSYFPQLLSGALGIPQSQIKNYGLQVYYPSTAQKRGKRDASFGTQYLAFIPNDQFSTLETYVMTPTSPFYNQPGEPGRLAHFVDRSFPLLAADNVRPTAANSAAAAKSSNRKRDIIIGVCVGVGGLLWIILVYWIYKRVKRNNERAVNKRLSEHMSAFSGTPGSRENPFADDRRHSHTPSIAASEIDDRPSSFYASPLDNYPAMRHRQVESYYTDQTQATGAGDTSPTSYVNSVFGTSWFQNTPAGATATTSAVATRASQNPFDDMFQRSSPATQSQRMSQRPQRRSVQKTMISQPTLQGNSLEFNEPYHGL